ncbi:hypothetical protein B0A49_10241 [Cryomyces minteri]|uniref:Ketoreductase domain-containing protein n=1 Tax=Cryomyces minteri TaxID=331657 RepID=A0A4U0WX62_9PEZI|nr:hypothetical protein B0A49_10241 [Cryomyces minteri]
MESSKLTLSGKVAIVTGASRGIGAGIAEELGKRGAKVVIVYTSPTSDRSAEELVVKIKSLNNGADAIKVQVDLRAQTSPEKIVSACVGAFGGRIDILVNNAGCELNKPLTETTLEDFDHVYDLNVRAVFLMTKAVVPHFQQAGRIINIGSVGGRAGFANLSLYCSSKAAMEGFTRTWAAELGKDGHTVNQVNPGPVQSAMLENIPKDIIEMQKKWTPLQNRLGTVDDIAQVVGFLAEEGSRWITGQVLSASGGWAMY